MEEKWSDMATIKELVQKETENFLKAQKLKQSTEKMVKNMTAIHEISKEARKPV